MSVITASQSIERAKGAAQERREIARLMRVCARRYQADLISRIFLKTLLGEILARGK